MISSMTGFGRGEMKENGLVLSAEIRSLNHRFLDVEVRMPKNLAGFEREIKELISSQLSRGRVNATISIKGEQAPAANLAVDKTLAATYIKLLNELKNELNLEGSIKLEQLLALPDIITFENPNQIDESILDAVKQVVKLALHDLKGMQQREGEEIEKDLVARINRIDSVVKSIEKHSQSKSQQVFEKLKEKVNSFVDSEFIEAGRLEMEVALLVEKMDVTEECIRFKSHNTVFLELLTNGASEGRKLNFLLQEMHREANTIGAKANDAQIAHWVVEIKEEVEKLREQIQNIE